MTTIEALFLQLRRELDPTLIQTQPVKLGKPYPLEQCLEISLAMQHHLQRLDPSTLAGPSRLGYSALAGFPRCGGSMRQVWDDLRGEYFQNAFLAGALYIDVSNDTVTRTKPPVEILSFADAHFKPVEDYRHFATLASRYWKAHFSPNHIGPTLAPYFPLIAVIPESGVHFQSMSGYILAVVATGEFRPSEVVLDAPAMKADLFELIANCLAGSSFEVASDPLKGRAMALHYCKKYRAEGYRQAAEARTNALRDLLEANKRLSSLKVTVMAP
ncbi:hypothetical protein [Herbaspirillum sp. GCM10030257]|uniref:hypothetical protein n=1 Tax=Herbaspirillum sp. GCM10030257 TaxID=3273393 RepID=UPI0036D23382